MIFCQLLPENQYIQQKKENFRSPFLRASCRIRTNDPEITNHVLWPTELKRRMGKLTVSRSDTDYLCCGQALEDSKGANRTALTH